MAMVSEISTGKGKKGKGYAKGHKKAQKEHKKHNKGPYYLYPVKHHKQQAPITIPYPVPYPVYQRPVYHPKVETKKIYVPIVKTIKVPVIIREKIHYVHTYHKGSDYHKRHGYHENSFHIPKPHHSSSYQNSKPSSMYGGHKKQKQFYRRSNAYSNFQTSDIYDYFGKPTGTRSNRRSNAYDNFYVSDNYEYTQRPTVTNYGYSDDYANTYDVLRKYNLL